MTSFPSSGQSVRMVARSVMYLVSPMQCVFSLCPQTNIGKKCHANSCSSLCVYSQKLDVGHRDQLTGFALQLYMKHVRDYLPIISCYITMLDPGVRALRHTHSSYTSSAAQSSSFTMPAQSCC